MASAMAVPQHKLLETPNSRTIEIYDWTITASTNPISNASECDALQAASGFSLPEMTFGNNYLTMKHRPSAWEMTFDCKGALMGVKSGELQDGDGGVKVGYADVWLKSRTEPGTNMPLPATVAAKPYDWTYTTTYSGHHPEAPTESSLSVSWKDADPENNAHTIPLAELTRPDPILFYAEVPLYEDELHDNGSSNLLVRIRVMPTCFLVLARLSMRVDGVLFRVHDTRVYHSFLSSPPVIVRQVSGWEAPYDRVKQLLPRRNDLTPLTDANWVAKVLTDMPSGATQKAGAGTGWRGLRTKVEVTTLAMPSP